MIAVLKPLMARFRKLAGGGGPPPPELSIIGAMLSDVGAVRESNEDSVTYVLPTAGCPGIAVVADGMGGHAAGEVASAIAVRTVVAAFLSASGTTPRRLGLAFEAANSAIRAHVAAAPETAGMGTTCTALAFTERGAFLAHIGDSRAYLVRGSNIRQISEDHSLVAGLVAQGKLTVEEAADSPERNVILRAMGITDHIEPQIFTEALKLETDDELVMCSDGLSDLVSSEAIRDFVRSQVVPEQACRELIAAALARGGHDNISVGIFRVCRAGQTAKSSAIDSATRETAIPAACN